MPETGPGNLHCVGKAGDSGNLGDKEQKNSPNASMLPA